MLQVLRPRSHSHSRPAPFDPSPRPKPNYLIGATGLALLLLPSFLKPAPQRRTREGFHRHHPPRSPSRRFPRPNSKSLHCGPLASRPIPSHLGAWPPRRSRRTRRPRPGALKERPTGSGATSRDREAQDAVAAGRSGRRRRSSSTATTGTTTATG